jgi:hypothetical protein
MILGFKLFLTPCLILLVTLAGRKWGQNASGILIGLPLCSGLISDLPALQQGDNFAPRVAVGSLGGQVSSCALCLVDHFASAKTAWLGTILAELGAFMPSTFALNLLSWTLLPRFRLLNPSDSSRASAFAETGWFRSCPKATRLGPACEHATGHCIRASCDGKGFPQPRAWRP